MFKKRVILILVALAVMLCAICPIKLDAYAANEKWRYAYISFLKKNSTHNEYSGRVYNRFHLAFIDGDPVPELILARGNGHSVCAEVYTYADGGVKQIGSFGQNGNFTYATKRGRIISYYGGMGCFYHYFYKVSNHKCSRYARYEFEYEQGVSRTYRINRTRVTQAEYRQRLNAEKAKYNYRAGGYRRGVAATTSNINKILNNCSAVIR